MQNICTSGLCNFAKQTLCPPHQVAIFLLPLEKGKSREKGTKEQECKFMVRQSCVDVASGGSNYILQRGFPEKRGFPEVQKRRCPAPRGQKVRWRGKSKSAPKGLHKND